MYDDLKARCAMIWRKYMDRRSRHRIVKTPKYRIPIGEAVKSDDGHYILKIKKPKGSEVEELTLDQLFTMVMTEAEKP